LNVLSNALPGFREVRAPLIVGYMWLLFVWFLVEPHARGSHRSAALQALIDLRDAVSSVGFAVGLSVAAYLVGSVSQSLTAWVPGIGSRIRQTVFIGRFRLGEGTPGVDERVALSASHQRKRGPEQLIAERIPDAVGELRGRLQHAEPLREALRSALAREKANEEKTEEGVSQEEIDAAQAEVAQAIEDGDRDRATRLRKVANRLAGAAPVAPIERRLRDIDREVSRLENKLRHCVAGASAHVRDEADLPATLLIGENDRLYADADRIRAEGELRLSVVAPAAALVILAAVQSNPIWLVGLALVAELFLQGLRRIETARDLVVRGIRFGTAKSSALEDFDRAYERLLAEATTLDKQFETELARLDVEANRSGMRSPPAAK
jgi:hypothetical protein